MTLILLVSVSYSMVILKAHCGHFNNNLLALQHIFHLSTLNLSTLFYAHGVHLYVNSLHIKIILSNRLSPLVICSSHEAVRQPQDAVFVFPFGC